MIIAELCQNHRGNLTVLKDMIGHAAESGAKFAKIQTFFADDLAKRWRDRYTHYKGLELSWDDHIKFVEWCRYYAITPMTSVYNAKYLTKLKDVGFKHVKIGSADAFNEHLIRFVGMNGMTAYVSTGGQDLDSIPKGHKNVVCYFHCVSKYPASYQDANLARFIRMKEVFPNNNIGFSDHTDPTGEFSEMPSMVASALGAKYIEKHFTIIDRTLTKDGHVSIYPDQLKKLCEFHNRTEEFKISMLPHVPLPMFKDKMDQEQIDTIKKYQTRWKD